MFIRNSVTYRTAERIKVGVCRNRGGTFLCPSPVETALPFKFRGQSTTTTATDDDDDIDLNPSSVRMVDTEIDGFTGIPTYHIHSSQPGSRRNAVVDSFFAETSPSTATSNSSVTSLQLSNMIKQKANEISDFLVYSRRSLHQHPELMYQEQATSAYVQSVLRELDIPFTTGWGVNTVPHRIDGPGGYGVVADIGTGQQPCVLLRADMDALPIVERTEGVDEFKSRNKGKMHACGHDGHTTMLLGAATLLKSMEDSINGTVRLVFQPAEEGGAGAKRMREEGVLTMEPKPQQAFAQHLWPTIPSGTIASRPGPILAAAERFEILVAGVGGHAAMPHLTVDPIVVASSMVMNLQTLVSRNLSPLESGVCSITKFEAGDAFNVIPHSAVLRGTIRALSMDTLLLLQKRVQHVVETTAAVHGANVTITYSPDFYPPTINDPELFNSFSKDVAGLVADNGQLSDIEPTMGAEDFSFIAESVPSTFFLLGQGSGKAPDTSYGLHHPHFALDESVLPRGVQLHVNVALRALHKLANEST
ncbi:peptidase M20D amidohydrolase family protein [Nitzschia inconspicua]|uniref:Peptidase M20D amidohydrolase family protein n=1 Tax=Nitzschia inconspicua TaxID=303405 RepID=A0A9K3LF10_9STRA|nr:peptidase M20D amidohydrolase family protein [Nitzschia inconspicua]